MRKKNEIAIFGRFDPLTGDMVGQTSLPGIFADEFTSPDGSLIVELVGRVENKNHYYLTSEGMVEEKFSFPEFDKTVFVADGIDSATLLDVPVGTIAQVWTPTGSKVYTISGGTLSITCDIPWDFVIELEAPHFKRREYKVEAR